MKGLKVEGLLKPSCHPEASAEGSHGQLGQIPQQVRDDVYDKNNVTNLFTDSPIHLFTFKKAAFTLAEVLVTLGIIGVVAALTIPTFINNYQKRTFVVQLQKTYSAVANAAKMLLADENVDNISQTYLNNSKFEYDKDFSFEENYTRMNQPAGIFLKKYFRVINDCGVLFNGMENECISTKYKTIDSSEEFDGIIWNDGLYCVSIHSGASICMSPTTSDAQLNYTLGHGHARIIVDINGKKGPNIAGRDYFTFNLYNNGKLGGSYKLEKDYSIKCQYGLGEPSYASNCTDKIILDNWKMDY